jgi:hypothetical protein
MNLTATLELDNNQVKELIVQALMNEGILVDDKDVQFIVTAKEQGNQRDSWTVHEFTGVKIKNVKMSTHLERD